MLAVAEELGVDSIVLGKLNGSFVEGQEQLELDADDRAWLDALPDYQGRLEVVRAYTPWTTAERMGCYWPRMMSYVTSEGDVTPCCNYFDSREMNLGNVFREDGAEVWNSDAYRAFRRRLLSGDLPERCRRC
jgi:radical SAM protein with 4Fe4S-binding SPASM domain